MDKLFRALENDAYLTSIDDEDDDDTSKQTSVHVPTDSSTSVQASSNRLSASCNVTATSSRNTSPPYLPSVAYNRGRSGDQTRIECRRQSEDSRHKEVAFCCNTIHAFENGVEQCHVLPNCCVILQSEIR